MYFRLRDLQVLARCSLTRADFHPDEPNIQSNTICCSIREKGTWCQNSSSEYKFSLWYLDTTSQKASESISNSATDGSLHDQTKDNKVVQSFMNSKTVINNKFKVKDFWEFINSHQYQASESVFCGALHWNFGFH